jgi:hypothetical protein
MKRFMSVALLLVAAFAHSARAQIASSPRYSFPARIGSAAQDTLRRLLDSASAAGLPSDPLVAKIAEGALKGADDTRIVRAVRMLVRDLDQARGSLPARTSVSSLMAAASAIHAGVSPTTLRRLASVNRDDATLDVALVTLADLVANRVPADAASAAVEQLLRQRAPEADFMTFRSAVVRDVESGLSPESAVGSRAEAISRGRDKRLP